MLAYIIRLDDACPTMHAENWAQVESILDAHGIKPIVGIIPDSMNAIFNWPEDLQFWNVTAMRYRDKGWVIAQHGCHHVYQDTIKSEFTGLSHDEQKTLIDRGHDILCARGLKPTCFFAPAHAFDDTTVDVCRDKGCFQFISDGKALYPYTYRGMKFIPALFGTPHYISPMGVFTFVLHPNTMTAKDMEHLDNFCHLHARRFVGIDHIYSRINMLRNRGASDYLLEKLLAMFRNWRNS